MQCRSDKWETQLRTGNMKRLLGIALGVSGAIALQATGLAQTRSDALLNQEGLHSPVETRSELLVTDPISLSTFGQATHTPSTFRIYNSAQLREVTESLRVKPSSGGKILNVIPSDLIHTPSSSTTDTRAIDFFQVPPPNPGVGVNLNTQ